MSETVHYRTCPFCEATCGLAVTMRDDEVVSVRGDADDVFSRGFLCPKSQGLKQLHEDPDRLERPLVRRDGELVEASWEEAFAAVDEGLSRVLAEGGRDAVAVYLGNPGAHSLGPTLYGGPLLKALGTKNIYSASTVDQMPKQVSSGLMFGGGLSVPIPDVDRTDHFLILGANPLVSNGSLMTAPDMRGRIRAIRERGGKVVVIDPRRSRTAKEASEHHFIRPGTDAHLLFAIVNVLIADDLADPGRLAELAVGADEIEPLARPFTPEAVAPVCGIDAAEIRRIAARARGRRERRRLRADRDDDPALRDARELARRRHQLPHRQPRPRGRRDVRARRGRPAQLVAGAAAAARVSSPAAGRAASAAARVVRRAAGRGADARRSRRRARARCARW